MMSESSGRRRRRRRGKNKSVSAVDILTQLAREQAPIESSPESSSSTIFVRKMSNLELDVNLSDEMTHFSTATPGSLDSSLWELGSVEDEILSSPKIFRTFESFEIAAPPPETSSRIATLLTDIQKTSMQISTLAREASCLPRQCVSVPKEHTVTTFLSNLSSSVFAGIDFVSAKFIDAQVALPASWAPVISRLEPTSIGDDAPVVNRRQRRLTKREE